jgi:hypothetical protein
MASAAAACDGGRSSLWLPVRPPAPPVVGGRGKVVDEFMLPSLVVGGFCLSLLCMVIIELAAASSLRKPDRRQSAVVIVD